MTTPEEIADKLSEEERRALVDAKPHPTLTHELWTPRDTPEAVLAYLQGIGVPWLIWHFTRGSNPLTDLGMQVREYLLSQGERR